MDNPESDPAEPGRRNRRLERSLPPEFWTRERHPTLGRPEEVALFRGVGVGTVRKHIDLGDYRAFKDGDTVNIFIDSVFDHLERQPLIPPKPLLSPAKPAELPPTVDRPARRKGRPRKKPLPPSDPEAGA
jgi:hypothetical protein